MKRTYYVTVISTEGGVRGVWPDFEKALYLAATARDLAAGFLRGGTDKDAAMDFLAQWDYGDPAEETTDRPVDDDTYERDGYVMTWHTGLRSCALYRIETRDE